MQQWYTPNHNTAPRVVAQEHWNGENYVPGNSPKLTAHGDRTRTVQSNEYSKETAKTYHNKHISIQSAAPFPSINAQRPNAIKTIKKQLNRLRASLSLPSYTNEGTESTLIAANCHLVLNHIPLTCMQQLSKAVFLGSPACLKKECRHSPVALVVMVQTKRLPYTQKRFQIHHSPTDLKRHVRPSWADESCQLPTFHNIHTCKQTIPKRPLPG